MSDAAPDRASTDRLMQDLHAVLEDADALLRATAGQAGEKVQQARARAEETVRQARERLEIAQEDIALRAREVADQADRYVRENPWRAVGVAAGVAFVVGLLVARR
jgi:ElaB/YqjD/DUF883 family membrane-anchored ribosome-binding protein